MAEELGKIEKPSAEEFKAERKLYFIPLVFSPREPQPELSEIFDRYWTQVEVHVSNLEGKLSSVTKVYHEMIPVGGEQGALAIEELNEKSYGVIKARVGKGAEVQPLEDTEILTEFMDWSKCLASGLQNQRVFTQVYSSYVEVQKKRNDHLARQIDATLEKGETGMLLMREGHQLQFPPDIHVFYVSPPALDEIKRWLRDRESAPGKE